MMSMDLFIDIPTIVIGTRGLFTERAQELATYGWLDRTDVIQLRAEFPNKTKALDFLSNAIENTADGMVKVTFG